MEKTKNITWRSVNCPVCGKLFKYPEGGYSPKTCNSFECVHKYIHRRNRLNSIETHNNLPLYVWRKGRIDDYWLYADNEWIGIIIKTITHLPLSASVDKEIKLKHPFYHISFCPNADTDNIYSLVGTSTLKEAQELAEWYYGEWLKSTTT